MKKIFSFAIAAVLTAAVVAPVQAEHIFEEALGEVEFGVAKASASWAADGKKTAGEYYDVEYKPEWISTMCSGDTNAQTAAIDVDLAMSWDETYLYTWLSYKDPNGHNFTLAGQPDFWNGDIVQFSGADGDAMGDGMRLEVGFGKYSDTGELGSVNWQDYLGSGFAAAGSFPEEDCNIFVEGDVITYEFRIPFEYFVTADAMAVGSQCRVSYCFCWDGEAGGYSVWQLGSGISGGKDAGNHALVTLEAAPADSLKVLKGTPELDGKLDDIYAQSAIYTIKEDTVAFAWGGADIQPYDNAASYFLWDDNYLYVCTVNKDDTPFVLELDEKGWQNEAAEMWFIDEGLRHKIHAAADGTFFLGGDGDGVTDYDFENAKSVASFTDDGWCVEVALPMNNLAAGKEFSYTLQVNNILDEVATAGSASGSQAGDYPFVCVADTVSAAAPAAAPAASGEWGWVLDENYIVLDDWADTSHAFGEAYPGSTGWDWPEVTSGSLLKGTVIAGFNGSSHCWSNGTDTAANAFDGDNETFFDPYDATSASWAGLLLDQPYELTEIRIAPRSTYTTRLPGAAIQGSNDGVNWTDIIFIDKAATGLTDAPNGVDYHCFTPTTNDTYVAANTDFGAAEPDFSVYWVGSGAYQAYRYVNINGEHGDVGEIELYGVPAAAGAASSAPAAAPAAPAAAPAAAGDLVTDGLFANFEGTFGAQNKDSEVWKDSVNGYELEAALDDNNYWTDKSFHVDSAYNYFPQEIVDLVNGDKFTVEIALGELEQPGTSYISYIISDNDNFSLFNRVDGDYIEFKAAGNERPKVPGGADYANDSTMTVTFDMDSDVVLYVDGVEIGRAMTTAYIDADTLFVGHYDAARNWIGDIYSIRFYNRALTADEVAQNAAYDNATYRAAAPAVEEPAPAPVVEEAPAAPETPVVEEAPAAPEAPAAEEVVEAPVEEVVEAPAEEPAEVAEVVEEAPQTFDFGVIAAVAALVSAAGYALTKKR